MLTPADSCPLCQETAGALVLQAERYRIVRVMDTELPGFCRVIWQQHVAEMSDLPPADRRALMAVVFAVELALRDCYQPDKINLASFGNVVPHLHWHIICRWRDDPWFPEPIWGQRQRQGNVSSATITDAVLAARIAHYLASGAQT